MAFASQGKDWEQSVDVFVIKQRHNLSPYRSFRILPKGKRYFHQRGTRVINLTRDELNNSHLFRLKPLWHTFISVNLS